MATQTVASSVSPNRVIKWGGIPEAPTLMRLPAQRVVIKSYRRYLQDHVYEREQVRKLFKMQLD